MAGDKSPTEVKSREKWHNFLSCHAKRHVMSIYNVCIVRFLSDQHVPCTSRCCIGWYTCWPMGFRMVLHLKPKTSFTLCTTAAFQHLFHIARTVYKGHFDWICSCCNTFCARIGHNFVSACIPHPSFTCFFPCTPNSFRLSVFQGTCRSLICFVLLSPSWACAIISWRLLVTFVAYLSHEPCHALRFGSWWLDGKACGAEFSITTEPSW